jgi:metaxin
MMPPETPGDANGQASSRSQATTRPSSSIFSIPLPIKRLFDQFPLVTYPANELPHRSSGSGKGRGHALFLWTAHEDASERVASFNPNCLKWQVSLLLDLALFRKKKMMMTDY